MVNVIKLADSLDWPEGALETVKIQCAGKGYLEYQTWVKAGDDWGSVLENRDADDEDEEDDEEADDGALMEDTSPAIDLFALSEQDLQDIDFYQVLHLPYKPYLTQDDVKKAYRKACLKYHPDKSGRGEEDAVFLKVKAAFETLSTQKQAYDSTEMPLTIPCHPLTKHQLRIFLWSMDPSLSATCILMLASCLPRGGK